MSEDMTNVTVERTWGNGSCLVWFIWGLVLSVTGVCTLVLLTLVIASTSLNAYLAWVLSEFDFTITQVDPGTTDIRLEAPGSGPDIVTATPQVADAQVQSQVSTLVAITTGTPEPTVNSAQALSPPTAPAPISTPTSLRPPAQQSSATRPATPGPLATAVPATPIPTEVTRTVEVRIAAPQTNAAPRSLFTLLPIKGERGNTPAEEDPDLNLKLRDPQPIEAALSLIDINDSVLPDPPKLSLIFQPDFVAAYTIHDWDEQTNEKGDLLNLVALVGLKTEPGKPVFIPRRQQDIYPSKYYAVVLYASEDSLIFAYNRENDVSSGYVVYYEGLQTDPDLLTTYQYSIGNDVLPGLTLDIPVGIASNELRVAIRMQGIFKDVRSKKNWWDE